MMFPRRNALFTEGEEQRRLRVPLDQAGKALPPRKVARLTSETCDSLIDGLAGKSEADLMADYAVSIPTIVMGQLLGLDVETARELAAGMITFLIGDENAHAANRRNEEILADLVHARLAEPADDMTSVLIQHPNLRDELERLQAMHVTVAGANDNSVAWIAQTLLLMLTDLRFSGRLRGGRLGVDEALEEVLWRDPPMPNFPARYALRDTVLGGQPIAAGDALILGFTAANADPRVHGDDSWSELGNRSHLAWGAGSHVCPAQVPARIIARTAVETALHRLPGLKLAMPAEQIPRIASPWIRAPAILPVTFTPF
jgi:cytochrome P450